MIKKQPVNAKGQTEEEFLKAYDAGRYPVLPSAWTCLYFLNTKTG